MYSSCLFCHASLGRNELIESFTVGRRLAFDAEHGRLWVVCQKCERWNLTPVEERWEAIDTGERMYRDTRARIATDEIGLARFRDSHGNFDLVRIGRPLRPELAAWRYGDQFGRRRRKHLLLTGAALATGGALVVAGPVMGLISLGAVSPIANLVNVANAAYSRRTVVRIPASGDEPALTLRHRDLGKARLLTEGDDWRLTLVAQRKRDSSKPWWTFDDEKREVTLEGAAAVRAAGALLPPFNDRGASQSRVQEAVSLLEQYATPEALFRHAAVDSRERWKKDSWQLHEAGIFKKIPSTMRLALEMAAHEESERRAMEGELALLEAAWREAEEIAKIADAL